MLVVRQHSGELSLSRLQLKHTLVEPFAMWTNERLLFLYVLHGYKGEGQK